jgi:HD-like signal output (HDOD) protein
MVRIDGQFTMNTIQPKLTIELLNSWLEDHKALPMFPSVITRLDEVLNDANVSVELVTAVLETDIGVVARIMKTVNSAKYVVHSPVQNLEEAVRRLGFSTVRMLACAASFMNMMSAPKTFSARVFWRNAFVTAVAARELVLLMQKRGTELDISTAFTLGLAHDLGIFLLDSCCADRYGDVALLARDNPIALARIEQQELGINHAIAGSILLRSWHFPEEWIMAVAGHHFPARLPVTMQPWADVLLAAENMSFYLGFNNGICASTPNVLSELTELRLGSIGLNAIDFGQVAARVRVLVNEEGWLSLADEMPA